MDATESAPTIADNKDHGFLQDPLCPRPSAIFTDPSTGAISGRCAPGVRELGLDPDEEISKLMTDSVLSRGIVVVDKQA